MPAHVTCPECGDPGEAINNPGRWSVGVGDVDELRFCYGDFGIVFHRGDLEVPDDE